MAKQLFFWVCFLVYQTSTDATEIIPPGITVHRNIPPNHSGPKIALVTFISDVKYAHQSECYNPYPDTVKFGTKSKDLYCQKHGYDFIIGSEKIYECDGHPAPNENKLAIHWMKVPMLARFLSDYDWVIWTDADSIFLNPDIKLESLLDDYYDVLFGTHILGQGALGTGHVFVKNSKWSRDFLNEWWTYSEEEQEGKWDLENLNDMLRTKSKEYWSHLKLLPTKLTDLSPTEYEPGDFMVHFYAYHGKELFQIFKLFEEKYGDVIKDLESEVLENSLSQDRYTDHIRVFKIIFAQTSIKGLLEFGLGNSTQYFLNKTNHVVSVEFITNALNPDWLNLCLDRYKQEKKWYPIAFLSGCSNETYKLGKHENFKLVQASSKLYNANSQASHLCNRKKYPLEVGFADELDQCVNKILKKHPIDLAFVDSGLILRGEIVQSLFNKVPIIAAHDFPGNLSVLNPDADIYGYSFIRNNNEYHEFYIGPPICMQGIKIWVKNEPKYDSLIKELKNLTNNGFVA